MRLFVFLISVCFINNLCLTQDDSIFNVTIDEIDTTLLDMSDLNYLLIDDYNLTDDDIHVTVLINDSSLFQIKDSSIYNGSMCIILSFGRYIDVDGYNSCCGVIEGLIKNGKKEGEWIETLNEKNFNEVLLKQMNYKNGFLDGDYYVYSTEKNTKFDSIRSWEDSTKYFYTTKGEIISPNKNSVTGAIGPTSSFENGTGLYLDYYNDTGILKEKGWLKHGQREGRWCLYDTEGKLIKVDIYRHGNCITDF